jgi:diketogulonate reductase-like aldo/keto reductase
MEHFFTLSNGVAVPQIGFGTRHLADGQPTYEVVAHALAHGYRHIDTAYSYGNQASVGRAIRDSGIRREELFITATLPAEVDSRQAVMSSFQATMAALELDYLDLYLAPPSRGRADQGFAVRTTQVWTAMEELYVARFVRAIGVVGFNAADLHGVLADCNIRPMLNQMRCHIGHVPREVIGYCRRHAIQLAGFSPLAGGSVLDDERVLRVAARYGKSAAQIGVRYLLQSGVMPLPTSATPSHIAQNADIDFDILNDDMRYLDCLTASVNREETCTARD